MDSYYKQLETEQWKTLRSEVFKRDGFECTKCGASHNLNVHHKQYIPKRKAWQYHMSQLVTLCEDCHFMEHRLEKIKNILRKRTSP